MRLGLEVACAEPPREWRGARLGLLSNQASLDSRARPAADLLARHSGGRLAALFGPQHGLWCEQQDDMDETPHGFDSALGVPVYSLYERRREPTPEMLAGLDHLVCDLVDVGTRVYTYAWTLTYLMQAAARTGLPVWVLDRPNPLGGRVVEGPLLEAGCESFVGRWSIPMRHGLTLGELARLLNREMELGCELHVVPAKGWRRDQMACDGMHRWIPPSPNLPRFPGVLLYPGTVLLEGTEASEGRGTTTPFEVAGTPATDPRALCQRIEACRLPGLAVSPWRFQPTFQKHAGESVGGVFLHVTDPRALRAWSVGVAVLAALRAVATDFAWRRRPYEYVRNRPAIDLIAGTPALRAAIEQGGRPPDLDRSAWSERCAPHRLYEPDEPFE